MDLQLSGSKKKKFKQLKPAKMWALLMHCVYDVCICLLGCICVGTDSDFTKLPLGGLFGIEFGPFYAKKDKVSVSHLFYFSKREVLLKCDLA